MKDDQRRRGGRGHHCKQYLKPCMGRQPVTHPPEHNTDPVAGQRQRDERDARGWIEPHDDNPPARIHAVPPSWPPNHPLSSH